MLVGKIKKEIRKKAKPEKLAILSNFFKTGKGQYAEGDKMLCVSVPDQREIAKKYFVDTKLADVEELLKSKYHEDRLTGLIILTFKMRKADEKEQKKIVKFYLAHLDRVNNWDLVDLSAGKILGRYLLDRPRGVLYKLAKSGHLWSERVAIVATFEFIRMGQFEDTVKLAAMYLGHSHDLIHKATGWMLREVGKRDEGVLRGFLARYHTRMPRVMYRYATERIII
ncbi:MAG TPA: DNA alkylation repair protein [Candidatus Magasanikbacteria bacterium]|nr:DNA alkylation repair protein [Candidatus Magasanikbacteria bacterium]